MINTQYIRLNMTPSGVVPTLHCSQYDVGRPLGIVVYNGSESVSLSGYTCSIEATRTDGTAITAGVTTDGNIGVFTTTATMTNVPDIYKAQLVLTDGNGKRVASLPFAIRVVEAAMDENAESIEEDASLYEQYTGTVQTIIAAIRADLAAEITARQNAVSAEATARQNAITAEANARAAAVSAEAAARQSADNTLQSNINAEASTRATADTSLQSQIDQLIAPSGEAPSAAEVENARIGSDGTVYPTLGDAIRTQNSDLKSQLYESIYVSGGESAAILTSSDWEQGYLKPDTGGMSNADSAIRTPFMHFKNALLKWTEITEQDVKLRIFRYDPDTRAFLGYDGWYQDPEKVVLLNGLYKFVVTIQAGTAITPSDIDTFYTFTAYTNEIPSKVNSVTDIVYNYGSILTGLVWSAGSITPATQVVSSSTKRIVTREYTEIDSKPLEYHVADGYRAYFFFYDDSSTPTVNNSHVGWVTGDGLITETKKYTRFMFGKADDSTFGTADFSSDLFVVRAYEDTKILENTNAINALNLRIDNIDEELQPQIPDYWETAINTALASIKTHQLTCDIFGDSFIFITDTHWPTNAKNSPALIKKILADKEVNINKVLFGGDVLNLHSTQATAYGILRAFTSAMETDADYYPVAGNHDWNDNVASTYPDAHLDNAQVYSTMFKKSEADAVINRSEDSDRTKQFYYYVDNQTQKIRYIFLQNGKGGFGTGEQAEWLKARLTELSADWTVLVFAHMYWYGLDGNNVPTPIAAGTAVTDAIDAVYDTMNATLAALIVGHCHYDYAITATKGYKIISTTTDNYRLSDTAISPTMTVGTDTEQAFDIYQIDTANRTIYIVRIGAGADRTISY